MSTYYSQYQPTSTLPINAPRKGRHNATAKGYNSSAAMFVGSPPERPASIASTSSGESYSVATSRSSPNGSEKSSTRPYQIGNSAQQYLTPTYDASQMDQTLARQAQLSGELNAKQREILALRAQAQARLAKTRVNVAEGMKAAREVQGDLEWTQQKMAALNLQAAAKYPAQYRVAAKRYPKICPGTDDEDSDSSSSGSSE